MTLRTFFLQKNSAVRMTRSSPPASCVSLVSSVELRQLASFGAQEPRGAGTQVKHRRPEHRSAGALVRWSAGARIQRRRSASGGGAGAQKCRSAAAQERNHASLLAIRLTYRKRAKGAARAQPTNYKNQFFNGEN